MRLLLVPAYNVFDATVAAVLRLQASDVFVGESTHAVGRSPGAAARRSLGAERRPGTCTASGSSCITAADGTDTFHLGAHDPRCLLGDLDLIHHVWLDAVKALGPHVHHHDVVRAALTQMAEQLNGPGREDALRAIQVAARPGDELAAIVRTRTTPGSAT